MSLYRVGVTLRSDFSILGMLQCMPFQFDYLCSVTTYGFADIVRYVVKYSFFETPLSTGCPKKTLTV